jgi:hypothetical protein
VSIGLTVAVTPLTVWHQEHSLATGLPYRVLMALTAAADEHGITHIGDRTSWAIQLAGELNLGTEDWAMIVGWPEVSDTIGQLKQLGELSWDQVWGRCTFPAYPGNASGPATWTGPPTPSPNDRRNGTNGRNHDDPS